MATSNPLCLNLESTAVECKVHPVVVFNILDHYIRRNENQDRVIGTLLGYASGPNTIEIRNSFPVPHSEISDQVAVDTEFHKNMFDLHLAVNKKETIVGWYATGQSINHVTVLVHDFYGKECSQAGHTMQPVHLTLDTELHANSMATHTYVSSAVSLGNRGVGSQFHEVIHDILPFESARFGELLNDVDVSKLAQKNAIPLGSEMDTIQSSLQKLLQNLDIVINYVEAVAEGKLPGDTKIGRFLGETLSLIPKIKGAAFDKHFNASVQDLLMVAYLANLTQTQLALRRQSYRS